MTTKVSQEQGFQVLATNFSIGPTTNGYTLQVSADGKNFSDLFSVDANTTRMVTSVASGSYYRLKNNTDDNVVINWQRQCNDGGSGGGGGAQGAQGPMGPQGMVGPQGAEGAQGPQGPMGPQGMVGPQGAEGAQGPQGPAGSGEGGDSHILKSSSSTPQGLEFGDVFSQSVAGQPSAETWTNFDTAEVPAGQKIVRVAVTGDGEYLFHFDDNNYYVGFTVSEGSIWSSYGGLDEDGVDRWVLNSERPAVGYIEFDGTYLIATITDDTYYWSMLDAYGTGGQRAYGVITPAVPASIDILAKDGEDSYKRVAFEEDIEGLVDEAVEGAISGLTEDLRNGDLIVGMAAQLYSPDGVDSDGYFNIRTTGGEDDVNTGRATLKRIGAEGLVSYVEFAEMDVTYNGNWMNYSDIRIAASLGNETGTYTYTYDGSDWSPALPDGIELDDITPAEGDEIVIDFYTGMNFTPTNAQPDSFIALGLNSLDYTGEGILTTVIPQSEIVFDQESEDYTITESNENSIFIVRAVPNLENGYIVYAGGEYGYIRGKVGVCNSTDLNSADIIFDYDELEDGTKFVVTPDDEHRYIIFSAPYQCWDSLCVHPRWSGIKDEEIEPYTESVIDLSDLPRLRLDDYIDFEAGEIHISTQSEAFSWARIDELEASGVWWESDGEYIYTIGEDTVTPLGDFDNTYEANDFSVELFAKNGEVVGDSWEIEMENYWSDCFNTVTETYYMSNLVDKLRRMENNFIHLNSLDTAGEEGKTYEYKGRLFKWVNGAGVWGEWLSGWDSNNQYPDSDGPVSIIFKYSKMPVGELCRIYDFNNLRTYLVYDGEKITSYTDSTHTTVRTAVTIGCKDVNMSNQTNDAYKVLLTWTDGKLIFKTGKYASLRNRANTALTGPHYEALDMSVAASNDAGAGDAGLPIWNREGIVIGKKAGYNNKTIYFNTTGYTNAKIFLAGSTWQGPDRIFVPTQGGTQGQVLTSNGNNAEPVWETMIKAVKITSDAYDALAVKDPNTLYLIDDNA